MELKQLVESYRYQKTFVGVYGAYKEEHAEFASDDWMIKMDRKYNAAKAFLSYIEKAITVLPINTRSNYNNQYEMLYRKVYMEEVKIKDIAEQLNTSRRNAYSIKAHALELIEERVALLFNTTYQITPLPVPKNLSVTEGFRRCGNAEIDSYYEAISKAIYSAILILCTGVLLIAGNVLFLILPILYWFFLTVLLKQTEEKWLSDLYGEERHVARTTNRFYAELLGIQRSG